MDNPETEDNTIIASRHSKFVRGNHKKTLLYSSKFGMTETEDNNDDHEYGGVSKTSEGKNLIVRFYCRQGRSDDAET